MTNVVTPVSLVLAGYYTEERYPESIKCRPGTE